MKALLMVGGPYDGAALNVPDYVTRVDGPDWSGFYQRKALSANVEVFEYAVSVPVVNRWEPRRRIAHFEVDKRPFAG